MRKQDQLQRLVHIKQRLEQAKKAELAEANHKVLEAQESERAQESDFQKSSYDFSHTTEAPSKDWQGQLHNVSLARKQLDVARELRRKREAERNEQILVLQEATIDRKQTETLSEKRRAEEQQTLARKEQIAADERSSNKGRNK